MSGLTRVRSVQGSLPGKSPAPAKGGLWKLAAVALALWLSPAWGADAGFVALFNGRDLEGWKQVNPSGRGTRTSRDPFGVIRTRRGQSSAVG